MLTPTAMAKLRARLEELAAADGLADRQIQQHEACRAEVAAVERKLAKAAWNLAESETPAERRALAAVLNELDAEAVRLRGRLREPVATPPDRDPEREVEAALGRLDELAGVAGDGLAAAAELIGGFDARLYLRFRAEARGKRTIQAPSGGVLTFGSAPPPGPLYDGPGHPPREDGGRRAGGRGPGGRSPGECWTRPGGQLVR